MGNCLSSKQQTSRVIHSEYGNIDGSTAAAVTKSIPSTTTTTNNATTNTPTKAPPPANGTVAKSQPTPPPPAAFAPAAAATPADPIASKNTTPLNHQNTVAAAFAEAYKEVNMDTVAVAQETSPQARPATTVATNVATATAPSETTTTTTTTKENVQGVEDTSSSKPITSSNGTKVQVEETTADNGYDPMADADAFVDQMSKQVAPAAAPAPAPAPKEETAVPAVPAAPAPKVVEEKKSETTMYEEKKEPNEKVPETTLEATTTNETTTPVTATATAAMEVETPIPAPAAPKVLTSADIQLDPSDPNFKLKRKLAKKLRQIELLEQKGNDDLTPEQLVKIESKTNVLESLQELE
jgi:hypothetical protein